MTNSSPTDQTIGQALIEIEIRLQRIFEALDEINETAKLGAQYMQIIADREY